MLVFSCSIKVEIDFLKEFLDSKMKKSTAATRSQFLLCLVFGILRSFMDID